MRILIYFLLATASALPAGEPVIAILVGAHDAESSQAHDFTNEASQIRAALLAAGVQEAHIRQHDLVWPGDEAALAKLLDGAATLVVIGNSAHQRHPLYVDGTGQQANQPRLDLIERHLKRGMGLVMTHNVLDQARIGATEVRSLNPYAQRIFSWLGGGALGEIEHVNVSSTVCMAATGHPTLRGVQPWTISQECYYFDSQIITADSTMTLLLTASATVSKEAGAPPILRNSAIAWAKQRSDGGRSLSLAGLPLTTTYHNADALRFIAQGIAWSANIDVVVERQSHVLTNYIPSENQSENPKKAVVLSVDIGIDYDDHIDLATAWMLPDLDIRGIITTHAELKSLQPMIDGLQIIKNRKMPAVIELSTKPKNRDSSARRLAEWLPSLGDKVSVIETGPFTLWCLLARYYPDVMHKCIERLYINAGRAKIGKGEYNWGYSGELVRHLFADGGPIVPVVWAPCVGPLLPPPPGITLTMQQRKRLGSGMDWVMPIGEMHLRMHDDMKRWIAWTLLKKEGKRESIFNNMVFNSILSDVSLLSKIDAEFTAEFRGKVNTVFCTPTILHAAGRYPVRKDGRWSIGSDPSNDIYRLHPVRVLVDLASGDITQLDLLDQEKSNNHQLHLIKMIDKVSYIEAMRDITEQLLNSNRSQQP